MEMETEGGQHKRPSVDTASQAHMCGFFALSFFVSCLTTSQTYKGKFGYTEDETLVLKQAHSSSNRDKKEASSKGANGSSKKSGKAE